MSDQPSPVFSKVVGEIGDIGRAWHTGSLEENARRNAPLVAEGKSLKDLPKPESRERPSIVISAGPSLHKFSLLEKIGTHGFSGDLVSVDGSYIKSIKAGLVPEYMLSLDPHPTRMVRWFGDPDFEKNMEGDDYFDRQDLDVDFRNNSIRENQNNIELVNEHAPKTKLILCTSAPENVVERSLEAGFEIYWWNPLVDNPNDADSLTRKLYEINRIPCMNTGGTVGTASWVFAHSRLKSSEIAVIGMDLGYHADTPYEMTQTYGELQDLLNVGPGEMESLFPSFVFPLDGQRYYTDPTYFWYRKNLLELLQQSEAPTWNCSEGGTLFGEGVDCCRLEDFLKRHG